MKIAIVTGLPAKWNMDINTSHLMIILVNASKIPKIIFHQEKLAINNSSIFVKLNG